MDINNQYGTYERQCKLLEMMKELHSVFKENGVQYSLSGGSALGAVRHKGFIPWDDDIDMILSRENFNRLVCVLKKNCKYKIVQDNWVPRIVNKELSQEKVYIDLFIVDNVPEREISRKLKIFILKILQGMMKKENIDWSKYSFAEKILVFGTGILGKFFTFKLKKHLYSRVSQWGNKTKTRYINEYNSLFKYLPHKYPREMVEDYILMKFEDSMFYVMKGYNEYLTIHYGSDYMIPPPVFQQVPQHIEL